jgi:hypothetical protein
MSTSLNKFAGPESHPFNHRKDSDVDEPPPRIRLGGIKLRLLVWKLVVTDSRHVRQARRGLREHDGVNMIVT